MKSQFSVLVNNSPIYVTNVEIKEDQVILTLASSFTQTQNVTLSYVSGVGGIADLNGNLAGYIDLRPVSYGLVMEGIRSAIVRGDTITVTFNGGLMPISNLSISQFYVAVDEQPDDSKRFDQRRYLNDQAELSGDEVSNGEAVLYGRGNPFISIDGY